MREVILKCNGKINLGLDVIDKRQDGYHNIKTIMQEIDLYDSLIVERIDDGFILESNEEKIPLGKENIVYKVWYIMKEKFNLAGGIKIYIEKNIPVAAGLAGGSTNGAGLLRGINLLWNLGLTDEELEKIGLKLGADIPFCLAGGTLLAEGIGERFTRIQTFKGVSILLVNPNFPLSTEKIYESLSDYGDGKLIDEIVKKLDSNDLDSLKGLLYNKMEDKVLKDYPQIGEIKEYMIKYGAKASLMSGSGPTVFGIFESEEDLNLAYDKFRGKFNGYIVLKTKTI